MELVVLVLVVFVVWLWMRVMSLSERLDLLQRRVFSAADAAAAAPPVSAPSVSAGVPAPGSGGRGFSPGVTAGPEGPASEGVPAPASIPTPAQEEPQDSWEITVGTSWLNKIGVLTLVIGVALLVRYSFPLMGPEGRIAIGFVLSGGLLGAGIWLERRDTFRNYAYGLIAGGWAGLYFTTFAMHDVPAAKIIHNDFLAVSLLLTVAAGMIAHSLRYRSQIVTSLAFVVAYATLALSPLSGFSLAASVPLAMAVLVVSQRLGWPAISAIGITATYGVFILRSQVFPDGMMDPSSTLPYATLAAYWLTFEIADLIGLRLRRLENPATTPFQLSVSMLALNAAGFLGSIIVISPGTHPELRSTLMFGTGAAYIVSAIVRAWLLPERRAGADTDRAFDVSDAATAMASLLFAAGIMLRFKGVDIPLGWLLETQMLFVAALTLSDRWLRRMASVVAAPVTAGAWLCLVGVGRVDVLSTELVAVILVALVWYANRESIRIKGLETSWLEPAYTWAATALLLLAAWAWLTPAYFCLASWLLGLVLLETGLRRDHDYTRQSYVIGVMAGYTTLMVFATLGLNGELEYWGPAPTSADNWIVLPAAIAICTYSALRLIRFTGPRPVPAAQGAAGVAIAMAAALTMVFEWRVLTADAVAPAWAVTALTLAAIGRWKSLPALRLLGYAMALIAAVYGVGEMLLLPAPATSRMWSVIVVAALAYATAMIARRLGTESEKLARALLIAVASAVMSTTILTQARPSLVTLLLALQGLAVMATGLIAGERVMRLSGMTLLLGCLLKVFFFDLRELEPIPRIFSFVVLGLVLLGISWVYTRYREQIRKLL